MIAVLDSRTGNVTRVLTGHTGLIGALAFSPDGGLLVSESGDGTARLWNVATGQEVLQVKLTERGASVVFSSDGKAFAVATEPTYDSPPQPIVALYARSGQLVREFPRSRVQVTSMAFSTNGGELAIASGDAAGMQIDIWKTSRSEPESRWSMPGRVIKALAFSTDGRLLALGGTGNGKGLVEVRDIRANTVLQASRFQSDVTAIDFVPDGAGLVVGTDRGQISILQIQLHR